MLMWSGAGKAAALLSGGAVLSASIASVDSSDALTATASPLTGLSALVVVADSVDVASGMASVIVAVAVAAVDATDTISTTVMPVVGALSAVSDGADTFAASANTISGLAALVAVADGADVASSAAAPVVGASISASDGPDGLAATVSNINGIGASIAATDGADVMSSASSPIIGAASSLADSADAFAAFMGLVLGASVGKTDGADQLASTVQIIGVVAGGIIATDGGDILIGAVDSGSALTMLERIQALLSPLAPGRAWYAINTAQPPVYPYIVWQRIVSTSNNTLDGPTDMQNTRVQVDVYAQRIFDAKAVADAVYAAMVAADDAGSLINVPLIAQDMYEPEVRCFRVSQDYSIWAVD